MCEVLPTLGMFCLYLLHLLLTRFQFLTLTFLFSRLRFFFFLSPFSVKFLSKIYPLFSLHTLCTKPEVFVETAALLFEAEVRYVYISSPQTHLIYWACLVWFSLYKFCFKHCRFVESLSTEWFIQDYNQIHKLMRKNLPCQVD